jgi:hypothetical protein
MKYIKRLKESLILNFNESLKFSIILRVFTAGLILILISDAAIILFYNHADNLISLFIGFAVSYFLFADTSLYLFRNIKKINIIKFNLTAIKDLLIILFFFIISYKLIKFNFILVAAGITITPVSISILWIFFPFNRRHIN